MFPSKLSLALINLLDEHNLMQRVLLIEDGPEIQVMVRGSIGKLVNLTVVPTVAKAMECIEETVFDLFIIDIVLPDGNGFHLCTYLRSRDKTSGVPIIFLTNKSELKDKLMGFSLGADDYVVKPFDPLELRARVESKLKRTTELKKAEESIWLGNLKISIPFQRAFLVGSEKEKDLGLSPKEFGLLYYFVKHEGHILSREQLLEAIWGGSINVIDRTVDTHVCLLRRKLTECSHHIESVFGEGYRFSESP